MSAGTKQISGQNATQHDLVRGIWQLCRLHTFEGLSTASIGWLALFFYAIDQKLALSSLTTPFSGIFASYLVTHGVFCMWNDICDRNVDGKVARTKNRPLPSGMVTYPEAMMAFVVGCLVSVGITYATLGERVTAAMGPIWGLSFIYPLAKRAIWAPQIVLGLTMASCVLPPWVALGNTEPNDLILPGSLFGAIFSWLVYLDLIYASQDRPDDTKAGVKSLAVFLGDNLKIGLVVLGLLQIVFFATAAFQAQASIFLWIFGIAVWTISIPWSILSLNPRDRHSGGKVFLANAVLVIYLVGIAGVEVWTAA
ncbi:4-hydroxybenzoate octaprenyltransferase [Aspergillus affinis]|uniref:4-hydroxybenzoate octaprenyltransferase n=1 Tax=Aspergillus affinis TaxID=1070780 RepID=UPI0022FF1D5F|nr:UbiA-like polyprenyl transferase NtnF [Aspergillus affinis]KAI9037692.1 UbiA-like polyprenyl transferase NtnF [Aspergillus affinis]